MGPTTETLHKGFQKPCYVTALPLSSLNWTQDAIKIIVDKWTGDPVWVAWLLISRLKNMILDQIYGENN